MMSFGGRTRAASVGPSWSVVQLITRHFLSSRSRRVWTWGRISRPRGAWMSCGMTSRTRSPGSASSPVMLTCSSSGSSVMIASRMVSTPAPVSALTTSGSRRSRVRTSARSPSRSPSVSALLITAITGTPRRARSATHSASTSGAAVSTTSATSVFRLASRVLATRRSPRAPVSSRPAVSMNTTGPMPCSSIALYTGSVVVPGTSDTTAIDWPVTALTREDLPTFRLP